MRLNAPKKIVWQISLVLAALSIVVYVVPIVTLMPYAFWVMGVAWLLLFLGAWLKGF